MATKFLFNPLSGEFDYVSEVVLAPVGSTPNANAASISSDQTLTLQPADATHPGVVTTLAQTLAGAKSFSTSVLSDTMDSVSTTMNIGGTTASTINIGRSGATINIQGTTLYENVSQLQVTDPLITLNKGGGAGSAALSGIELEEAASITGYAKTSADRNSWLLKAPNTAGDATITPGASGIVINQSSHDPVTLTAVGSTPSANGASLSGQALTLQPADATHPGLITSGVQTIGGAKTLSSLLTLSAGLTISASGLTVVGTTTLDTGLTGPLKAASGVVSASAINLTSEVTGILPVANGGTGANALTANNVILGNGTSAVQFVAPGSSGNVLTSNGTTWTSAAPSTTSGTAVTTTSNYTVAAGVSTVFGSTGSGSITVTLPAAASNVNRTITIEKLTTDANTVTVATAGGDSINSNGITSFLISSTDSSVSVTAQGSGLWIITNTQLITQVVTKTTTYTASTLDNLILADTTSAAFTVTLPAASANKGKTLKIQKSSSDLNYVTIARAGSDTINGATSTLLNVQYEEVELVSDGTSNWYITCRRTPQQWTSYTPTWTSTGTAPSVGNGTITGMYRKEGDSLHVRIALTSGTTTAYGTGNYKFSIPNAGTWTIDTAKMTSITGFGGVVGSASAAVASNSFSGTAIYIDTQSIGGVSTIAANANPWGGGNPSNATASTANQTFNFDVVVPITNWSG